MTSIRHIRINRQIVRVGPVVNSRILSEPRFNVALRRSDNDIFCQPSTILEYATPGIGSNTCHTVHLAFYKSFKDHQVRII